MIEFMIAAPASDSGKTAVTCGLLALLAKKGYNPCAFKCGPDYIEMCIRDRYNRETGANPVRDRRRDGRVSAE